MRQSSVSTTFLRWTATPSGNDRYLRIGVVHCVVFARQQSPSVTGASTRLGFDPRGQTAKTARIEEPAALVIYNK